MSAGPTCVLLALATAALTVGAAPARAAQPAGARGSRGPVRPKLADALAGSGARSAPGARPRSPSAPPLPRATSNASESVGAEGAGTTDPLVTNGLRSPLCSGELGPAELPAAGRRRCETSGFAAAPAPTGDYGIDVHIDTGSFGLGNLLLSTVQELFVTPVWMGLVWLVHALVVMLEWAFTIDLLDSGAAGVGADLRRMQTAVTVPWLAAALAVAAVLLAYKGLVRRRALEATGEVAAMALMMAGGLWVMADPVGTVGAVAAWANQAGLGTLAVATRGTPARGGKALAESTAGVFAQAVEAPWCYLEFGDVGWCREAGRLDPRLRAAALKIAAKQLHCTDSCKQGSSEREALERRARLLREADTNGAIFLALPANGPDRNAISEEGSLLRVLCEAPSATGCHGPTAAQAEFRTEGSTWARVGGLLLILAGASGMLLLIGFIAARLLAAAVLSLVLLLIAPAIVLSPALGPAGRRAFQRWAALLLGAVVSKLVFAFLLGVVLAVGAILAGLSVLGWWTQWLLSASFWWGVLARRRALIGLTGGAPGGAARGPVPRVRVVRPHEARTDRGGTASAGLGPFGGGSP